MFVLVCKCLNVTRAKDVEKEERENFWSTRSALMVCLITSCSSVSAFCYLLFIYLTTTFESLSLRKAHLMKTSSNYLFQLSIDMKDYGEETNISWKAKRRHRWQNLHSSGFEMHQKARAHNVIVCFVVSLRNSLQITACALRAIFISDDACDPEQHMGLHLHLVCNLPKYGYLAPTSTETFISSYLFLFFFKNEIFIHSSIINVSSWSQGCRESSGIWSSCHRAKEGWHPGEASSPLKKKYYNT